MSLGICRTFGAGLRTPYSSQSHHCTAQICLTPHNLLTSNSHLVLTTRGPFLVCSVSDPISSPLIRHDPFQSTYSFCTPTRDFPVAIWLPCLSYAFTVSSILQRLYLPCDCSLFCQVSQPLQHFHVGQGTQRRRIFAVIPQLILP